MYLISLKKLHKRTDHKWETIKQNRSKGKKKKTQLDKKVIVVKLFIPTIIKFFLKIFLLI